MAILFNPSFRVNINHTILCENGRYIIAFVNINLCDVVLVCSYGPNIDNPSTFSELLSKCDETNCAEMIWGGDFNFVMEDIDRISTARRSHNNNKCRKVVKEYMMANDMVDIWRYLHPCKQDFTFCRSNPMSKSRLDFFLISTSFLSQMREPEAEIADGYLADHKMVIIKVSIKQPEFGRSYWKFNNSLLTDEKFVAKAKEQITLIIQENPCSSPTLRLQTVLCVFRGWSIKYTAHCKKQNNAVIRDLDRKINNAQTAVAESSNPNDLSSDLNEMIVKRDEIIENTTKSSITRNQARWRHYAERGTAYFHGLNKRHRSQTPLKCMALVHSMERPDIYSEKTSEMLHECKTYFGGLYAHKQCLSPESFLSEIELKTLSLEQSAELEAELTLDELKGSLFSMKTSTSPGPDGFTVPFYITFWTELADLIHLALKESYDRDFIPEEMRRSITVLIPKKNKDVRLVQNLRPISLLNVLFKILTKALARRIAKIIDQLVSEDQTGFIKGRYIGENIRLVLDLIQYAAEKKESGMLLFCDWEKAYDSLDWNYLKAVLRHLKFGDNFIKWINLIYPSSTSYAPKAQLQINGQLSEPYEILRGLRQGCPLSCSLFLIGIEPMLQKISDNVNIGGIHVGNICVKVSAYADDTLFVLDGTPSSLRNSIQSLEDFYAVAGLKLNKRKTQAAWIGQCKDRREGICPELNLTWEFNNIEYLGVTVDLTGRNMQGSNYSKKMQSLKNKLLPWHSYGLTPFGKIHLLKSEALSQLVYLMSVLPMPSAQLVKQLESIMFKFIWGKTEKIKRLTMKNMNNEGGFEVPDVVAQANSLKITWVKKFLDPACKSPWKAIMKEKLVLGQGITIFHCDGEPKLIKQRLKNAFWEEVADSWFKLAANSKPSGHEILAKPLWYSKDIKLNFHLNKSQMIAKGVIQVKNIYNIIENRLMTANELSLRYNITNFLIWNGLLLAIPRQWKLILRDEKPEAEKMPEIFEEVKSTIKCAKWSYPRLLSLLPLSVPKQAHVKWQSEVNLPSPVEWSGIYKKIYACTADFKLRWLQLRILHRIIPTNRRLCMYGIRSSENCDRCPGARETLMHLFWLCPAVQNFWTQIIRALGLRVALSAPSVVLGTDARCSQISEKQFYLFALLGKWYIWRCRFNKTNPKVQSFIQMCTNYIRVEKYTAVVKNAIPKFDRDWRQLNEMLKNSKHPP